MSWSVSWLDAQGPATGDTKLVGDPGRQHHFTRAAEAQWPPQFALSNLNRFQIDSKMRRVAYHPD